jgi:site-specific DNA recombinase
LLPPNAGACGWGGNVPLGYDAKDRKLIVNPDEAKSVRRIFSLYRKLGCVSKLKARLDREKAKSKVRTNPSGKKTGGVPHSRGALYKILSNRIYIGQISHKGQCHPGEHQAIIPRKLWDQVQAQLHGHNQGRRTGVKAVSPSLLVGLLWDSDGNKLTPSHALKDGRRYRYYCRAVSQQGAPAPGNSVRLPAHDIESRVLRSLVTFLQSESRIMDQLVSPEDEADVIERLFLSARRLAPTFRSANRLQNIELVRKIVYRVVIYPDKVEVLLRKPKRTSMTRPVGVKLIPLWVQASPQLRAVETSNSSTLPTCSPMPFYAEE